MEDDNDALSLKPSSFLVFQNYSCWFVCLFVQPTHYMPKTNARKVRTSTAGLGYTQNLGRKKKLSLLCFKDLGYKQLDIALQQNLYESDSGITTELYVCILMLILYLITDRK